jgi:hypothetical protein
MNHTPTGDLTDDETAIQALEFAYDAAWGTDNSDEGLVPLVAHFFTDGVVKRDNDWKISQVRACVFLK